MSDGLYKPTFPPEVEIVDGNIVLRKSEEERLVEKMHKEHVEQADIIEPQGGQE